MVYAIITPGKSRFYAPISSGNWERAPALAQISDKGGVVLTALHIWIQRVL